MSERLDERSSLEKFLSGIEVSIKERKPILITGEDCSNLGEAFIGADLI